MTEWVTYGSVGGAAGNSRSYPEPVTCGHRTTMSTSGHSAAASAGYRDCYASKMNS